MDDFTTSGLTNQDGGVAGRIVVKKTPDLFDVCLGKMDHINLKKVASQLLK